MKKHDLDTLLQTCEQEKLHLSGMIQPFGSLLVVDEKNLEITHVAENINEFIGFKADELLGKELNSLFPQWVELFTLLDDKTLKYPYVYQKMDKDSVYLKISNIDETFVIDIQKVSKKIDEKTFRKDQFKLLITPESQDIYLSYIENYMDIVSKVIDFDRIMLYQFQDNYNGKVISERTLKEEYGSYLNLMFPASDIPKIARDLYMINPSRIITDVDAKNIDILTTKGVPNLTYSDTRSVSPIHIEYLNNMGVKSSFSIPIVVAGKLWGLLACHNFIKKSIDPLSKDIAIEQTKMFALGTQNFKAKEKINYIDSIQYKIDDLLRSIVSSSNIHESIYDNQDEILNLIQSSGFAIVIKEEVLAFGTVPESNSFIKIDKILLEKDEQTLSSNSIRNEFFEKENYLGPAGVLGVKLKFTNNLTLRCYWFREEFVEELHWAGNPNKPVVEDENAIRLSPRRSFEKFIETKRAYSKKFTNLEVSTALKFANSFFKYLVKE